MNNMKPFGNTQSGSTLLEALVSMVLILVVGVGSLFATQEVVKSKTQLSVHSIAVNQMQNLLTKHNNGIDLCSGAHHITVPVGASGKNVAVPVNAINCHLTSSINIAGTLMNVADKIYLTAGNDLLVLSNVSNSNSESLNAEITFSRTLGGMLQVGAY